MSWWCPSGACGTAMKLGVFHVVVAPRGMPTGKGSDHMVQAQLSSRPASGIDQVITSEGSLLPAPAFANIPARGFMDPDVLDAQTAFFVRFLDVLHDTDAVRTSHRRTVDLLGVQ